MRSSDSRLSRLHRSILSDSVSESVRSSTTGWGAGAFLSLCDANASNSSSSDWTLDCAEDDAAAATSAFAAAFFASAASFAFHAANTSAAEGWVEELEDDDDDEDDEDDGK